MRLVRVSGWRTFLPLFYRLLTHHKQIFTDALLRAEVYFLFPLMFSLYIRCSMT